MFILSKQIRNNVSRGGHQAFARPLTDVRTRRHHWIGHILRMPADRLVRRAVLFTPSQDLHVFSGALKCDIL